MLTVPCSLDLRSRIFYFAALVAFQYPSVVQAGAFEAYASASTFSLPEDAAGMTVLADGRLLTVVGTDVYVETAVGSRIYARRGELAGADFSSFGPGFLRVSPDGTRLAVGNSGGASFGNYQVGVFDVDTLSGRWLDANHFEAAWIDDHKLAVTGGVFGSPGFVSVLDTNSADAADPSNPIVIDNIGGASAGVAFDAAGNLYTGNGFATTGPSATGAVRFFDFASWSSAQASGLPVDFEAAGIPVVEILSAAPLRLDAEGNLLVGGGDFNEGDLGYAGLVRGTALADAVAGLGTVDTSDVDVVRRFDPDPLDDFNFYSVDYNNITGELYVRDGTTVYAFVVPEPAALLLLSVGSLALLGRRGMAHAYAVPKPVGPLLLGVGALALIGRCGSGSHARKTRTLVVTTGAGVLICCVFIREGRAEISDLRFQINSSRSSPLQSQLPRGELSASSSSPCNFLPSGSSQTNSPFAVTWMEYDPAPGIWVQDSLFNDPDRALGRPYGGGTLNADLDSLVSLGGFGGSIILAFDHTVVDDPLNPYGLDAIVFGNAIWQVYDTPDPDPNRHWAECGTIEIARDVNGDGLANDAWYLIPGSHIIDPPGQFAEQTWDSNIADPTFPPDDAFWLPAERHGQWQTEGFLLPSEVFGQPVVINPTVDENREGVYGYADYTPTLLLGDMDADNVVDESGLLAEEFYTVPDDPFTIGISSGSGGGDAFDIAWAVDPSTGQPAGLAGFDFIRIKTAVSFIHGLLGEYSPEIDAVADVAPDPFGDYDGDGDIDLADAAEFLACYLSDQVAGSACVRVDREPNGDVNLVDFSAFARRITGPLS